jgi:hypothetical protein
MNMSPGGSTSLLGLLTDEPSAWRIPVSHGRQRLVTRLRGATSRVLQSLIQIQIAVLYSCDTLG